MLLNSTSRTMNSGVRFKGEPCVDAFNFPPSQHPRSNRCALVCSGRKQSKAEVASAKLESSRVEQSRPDESSRGCAPPSGAYLNCSLESDCSPRVYDFRSRLNHPRACMGPSSAPESIAYQKPGSRGHGNQRRHGGSGSGSGGVSGEKGGEEAGGGAAALAAATSVVSRYTSALRSWKPSKPPEEPPAVTGTGTGSAAGGVVGSDSQPAADACAGGRHLAGVACHGKDAADAAVDLGGPEFSAVLIAWEAAVAAGEGGEGGAGEGRGGVAEGAGLAGGEATLVGSLEKGGLAPAAEVESERRPQRQQEEGREEEVEEGEGGEEEGGGGGGEGEEGGEGLDRENVMAAARAGAAETLRSLDEADPQGALCLGPANAWVVKPAGLSCGRGIEVASTLRGLVSACRRLGWKAVVQKYVERPLLIQVVERWRFGGGGDREDTT